MLHQQDAVATALIAVRLQAKLAHLWPPGALRQRTVQESLASTCWDARIVPTGADLKLSSNWAVTNFSPRRRTTSTDQCSPASAQQPAWRSDVMGKMSTRMYSLSHKLRSSPSRDACLSQWSCPASNSTTCAGVATQTCAGGASSVWMAKVRCASCNFSLLPSPGEREALRVEALMSPSWPGGLPSP
eukprot:CAMPEP_0171116182 /NCGR_PEP_ID=MMETSP0766_2-20121228/89733_1 /TAXON_ID=439317 /ORGANISM="Gambierdiscus australes, Strain CAWD 149" /LENGTH=186 /DNA_ID=CAMNT_0011578603 /DNA_START=249 /DNA_END=807 /DNA_ORIENTATION=+